MTLPLSRGARLCESIIRAARARRGGRRECGRPYLARRLACSQRTVSRYVKELRDAGRLEVTPPRRVRTPAGWRTEGVNTYRLPCPSNPAPHVHNRRSRRGDTHVTPPPRGVGGTAPRGHVPAHHTTTTEKIDPGPAAAALLARLLAPSHEVRAG